jgi:predicted Zn-dependent protease
MEWYERAATIDPGTTGYHDSIARTAVELFHETDDPQWLIYAGEEESIARELNRLDARFPYRLGTIYALMADRPEFRQQKTALLAKASTFYAQAIDADPYSPFNYFELAQLYLADGRTDSAIALLQTATRYEPNYLPGRALLAELGLKQGRPGEYRQELQNLKTLQSTYESQAVDELDRQFLHVDLYPLARALAMETPR